MQIEDVQRIFWIVNNIEKLTTMDAQIKNGNSSLYNVQMPFIIASEIIPYWKMQRRNVLTSWK